MSVGIVKRFIGGLSVEVGDITIMGRVEVDLVTALVIDDMEIVLSIEQIFNSVITLGVITTDGIEWAELDDNCWVDLLEDQERSMQRVLSELGIE